MERLLAISFDHRSAPVALRERIRLGPDAVAALYRAAVETGHGLVVLSTCGRTELYTDDPGADAPAWLEAISAHTGVPSDLLHVEGIRRTGPAALRHLFRVASGLESAVLGEPQILGQVGQALGDAVAAGAASSFLRRAFGAALRTGRRVRHETGINREAAGLGTAAAVVARRHFGDLTRVRAVVVGTGEMGRQALDALRGRGLAQITVVSRRLETAQAMADSWGAQAATHAALDGHLGTADLLVTATAAPEPLIGASRLVATRTTEAPFVCVDLGMPRNVADDVDRLPGVVRYDLDALGAVMDAARAARRAEVPKAEALIEAELDALRESMQTAAAAPLLAALRAEAERSRRAVLDRARRRLPADDALQAEIDDLTRRLVSRLLHAPSVQLRAEASLHGPGALAEAARQLFNLPPAPEPSVPTRP